MAEETVGDAPAGSGDTGSAADGDASGSKKPAKKAKKTKKAAKKPAKKVAKKAEASSDDAAPAKPAKKVVKKVKKAARRSVKKEDSAADEGSRADAQPASEGDAKVAEPVYGRRPRRGGPDIVKPEERSKPAPARTVTPAAAKAAAPETTEKSGEEDSDSRDGQGDRRGRRRRGRRGRGRTDARPDRDNRERSESAEKPESRDKPAGRSDSRNRSDNRSEGRSDSNRSERRPRKPAPSRSSGRDSSSESELLTVEQMLAETWSEEKARKFLSDGFLSRLSPDIMEAVDGDGEAPELDQPLRTIRRLLADECMVEDDATDVMLLDIVVKSLSDWTQVYRIKPKEGALEEVERLMDIRAKADRRLMEAIAALKNS